MLIDHFRHQILMILGMIGEKIDYINLTKSTKFGVRKIYEAFLRYEAIRTVPPPRHDLLR